LRRKFVSGFVFIILFNLIFSLELKKEIGQLLIVGFRGFEVSDNSEIIKDIENYNLGGLVLFDYDVVLKKYERNIRNKKQVKRLIRSLKSYSEIPLFVAVDLEGGLVNRLKKRYGFSDIPSQEYVGVLNSEKYAGQVVKRIIKNLKSVGFNMNFSPVLDINLNPDNPIIGKLGRSFSSNRRIVYKMARIYLSEYKKNKIISVVKHFPGHGSSHNDSHKGVVDVSDYWKEIELLPYKKLISEKLVDFVMTAHIYNKYLDDKFPASLSKKIITGILKNKLGFNGVVVSDDLNMKAITNEFSLKRTIELALKAGNDILLFGNNLNYDEKLVDKVVNIVFELIKQGRIKKSRIHSSYDKIIRFKRKIFNY